MSTYLFRALIVCTIIVGFLTTGVASAAVSCPTITRTLQYNSRGADVNTLQTFLAQDKTLYPEGAITGFFGRATERAVQRFQASKNIVNSGTPATTGYGSVGARTRAALAACTPAASPQSAATTTTAVTTTPTTQTIVPIVVPQTPVNPLVTFSDGATTTITLGAGPIPAIGAFSFGPRSVNVKGDAASMYWTSYNTVNCSVQKTNGSGYETLKENVGINGSVQLTVNDIETNFSLLCTGVGDGSSSTPATIRRDVRSRIQNPVPTCTVTPNKSSYKYGVDSIVLTWVSTDADKISWSHPTGADLISLPYGNQYPSGSIFLSSVVGSTQTATLNVSGPGGSATCAASFSISPTS